MASKAVDLSKVPDAQLFAEARRRARELRATHGPYATNKKYRICKGCGGEYSARDMRSHRCKVPVVQR
jgi:hypothetical protein